MTLEPRHLRDGFGRFATGVTVVTCRNRDGDPHGTTVNAFTAVSLDPALCQVTLHRRSRICQYLDGAPFAVNVLAVGQLDTAAHFAGQRAAQPRWVDGVLAPVLVGNATTISCHPWRTYDGGDHLIFLGEVAHLEIGDAEPLLFFGGRFREIRPHAAVTHVSGANHGHHADEQRHRACEGTLGAAWAASVDCPDLGWFGTEFAPMTKGFQ